MCEQQRCISVQRSIHRVEVNARPYSGPRKERKGGRVDGSGRGSVPRSGGRRGDGRAEGAQARSGKKMNKHPERERDEGKRPGARPLSPLPPLFATLLSSSLFSVIVTLSRLSLGLALRCTAGCTGGLLTPRAIFLTSKLEARPTAKGVSFSPFLFRSFCFFLSLSYFFIYLGLSETCFKNAHVDNNRAL